MSGNSSDRPGSTAGYPAESSAEPPADAFATLAEAGQAVLREADAPAKAARSRAAAAWWRRTRAGGAAPLGRADPPDRPARPPSPQLLNPRDMPKRKPGSRQGRAALLHAIAHIELNAIDLHWDVTVRFSDARLPIGFFDDWTEAADQEAKHFLLLSDRMKEYGIAYGDLPAHDGLWRAAEATAHDLMARLAVVPMVLEARGLDVTPDMISLFRKVDDIKTCEALEIIYAEEVTHVAYGSKWFHFLCGRHDRDPKDVFHDLVRRYFGGALKPPFNVEKRAEAGLPPDFYWPLASQ